MCPNDNGPMQTVERSGVQFDMCPTCRGVWLDRGELEKLMDAAVSDAPRPAPQAPPMAAPSPWAGERRPVYVDRRRYDNDHHKHYKRKKRDSIFDIFD